MVVVRTLFTDLGSGIDWPFHPKTKGASCTLETMSCPKAGTGKDIGDEIAVSDASVCFRGAASVDRCNTRIKSLDRAFESYRYARPSV